ncbi:hypothetical protein S091751_1179 [Staphylococcus aureus subsp. aureus 091751]|nr:hypothetical protein S091751_1179 [Staphylococcus aureus subsp. aureus 091751]
MTIQNGLYCFFVFSFFCCSCSTTCFSSDITVTPLFNLNLIITIF